jgi:hypothetical protein
LADWELEERRVLLERQYRNLDLSDVHALAPPRMDNAERPWAKRLWRDIPLDDCLVENERQPDSAFAAALLDAVQNGSLSGAYTTGLSAAAQRLRLREDWVWDAGHGSMRPILTGIGLAAGPRSTDLILWVPMAAARPWLAQQMAPGFSPQGGRWSWYDLLMLRVFKGQVVRISNPMDLDLVDQVPGQTQQEASDQVDAWLRAREAAFWDPWAAEESP